MEPKRINLPELGLPVGPYVHAVLHQSTLYTSGFTAYGTDAQSGSVSEQARAIFTQLLTIAESQNTSIEKLVKVTLFVTDLERISELRDCLMDLYAGAVPASSLVKVDQLFSPELLIEIEAIFAL
ncbi:RidA family protein [Kiloniella laminariae]|uniref:RidA family protein n=1 Tax=Kiloniella laminariae TaxID=454162 RepID=A0ABT4LK14_9PROT|nr:RidA family protein [Kiloniella laminariae]MCZ4281448.1 RidA family protein [Kiloniella laminariae]